MGDELPKPQGSPQADLPALDGAPLPVPSEVQRALEKLPAQEAKGLLSVFLARSSTTFGPDPETAKVIAQSEMHEEDCRLKAYQSSLANKEAQGARDHEFRKKKLNHRTATSAVVLTVVVAGVVAGVALCASGSIAVGSPVLVASFTMLSNMAGKMLRSGDEE
jgi:hypothetical protein